MKASIIVAAVSIVLVAACAGEPDRAAPRGTVYGTDAVSAVTAATEEAPAVSATASVPVECRILLQGQNARTVESSVVVARSASAYASLWSLVSASGSARPDADFSKEAVVAAFMGRRRTGGHSIRLVSAESLADGRVRVVLVNEAPKPGAMVTEALASPFLVLAVPAAPGAEVFVEFAE